MLTTVVLLYALMMVASTLPSDCKQNDHKLTCNHSLPLQLPNGITEVDILQHESAASFTNQTFSDKSWQFVVKLEITGTVRPAFIVLENGIFHNLGRLKYLGYHDPELESVYEGAFIGLNLLETLNLADCVSLDSDSLSDAFWENNKLPHLHTLILDRVRTRYGPGLYLNEHFLTIVKTKKIKSLSLSGASFFYRYDNTTSGKLNELVSLNLSYSKIYWSVQMQDADLVSFFLKEFTSLRTVDISYLFIGIQESNIITDQNISSNCTGKNEFFLFFLCYFENLYFDGVLFSSTILDRSYLDVSHCNFRTKIFHSASNHVEKLNATIKFPTNVSLYEVDMSRNEMTYISPNVFSTIIPLRNLNLGSNKLSQMEMYPEFSHIFKNLIHLEKLTLSNNSLKTIPRHMFMNNKYLQELDLSYNLLKSVTFDTSFLTALLKLDLSGNTISVLDTLSVTRLDHLLRNSNSSSNYSTSIQILLKNNPYLCSCENIQSVKWLANFQKFTSQKLFCKSDNKQILIDEEALKAAERNCPKTIPILIGTGSAILFLLFIVIIVALARRRRRINQVKFAIERFIALYQNDETAEKFVAMLSYSSADDRAMIDYVYTSLNKTLKQIINVNNDTVCVDYKHFKLGLPIMNEMISAIENSRVIVFIISNSFCIHEWCIREFDEALEQKKPVILIYSEEVNVHIMPPTLRTVHNRFTRASVKRLDDGNVELTPSDDAIANSILELASLS